MLAAYPPERLEPYTDADTMAHDYATRRLGDGPVEWWNDARLLVCKFLRMAQERSEPAITGGLEELREKATVQQVLAERDYERRYVEPHKAMRPVETAGG